MIIHALCPIFITTVLRSFTETISTSTSRMKQTEDILHLAFQDSQQNVEYLLIAKHRIQNSVTKTLQ